ncbi:unnamed protein product [Vicia faba]|uniref:Uncharacterized protein n=1 Tax=Vicia faba TaxID=3906 RepID=A0AAV0YUJ0_VICFA|nr:unnamed protein product [Vicia faba]
MSLTKNILANILGYEDCDFVLKWSGSIPINPTKQNLGATFLIHHNACEVEVASLVSRRKKSPTHPGFPLLLFPFPSPGAAVARDYAIPQRYTAAKAYEV